MVERETHRAMLDEEGYLATGSRGQDTPHPVLARVSQIDTALLAIEDRLGLSPVARARLGLTVAQTGLTLSSIKAALNDAAAAASGDPRDD
jgi:P27 family predicted phage terminase small subunit